MTTFTHNFQPLTSALPFCVFAPFSPWILADTRAPNRPSCRALEGRVSSAEPPVCEALAFGRVHETVQAAQAVPRDIPFIQPERELIDVAEQVLCACVMIDAVQPALEYRPHALDAVGVRGA